MYSLFSQYYIAVLLYIKLQSVFVVNKAFFFFKAISNLLTKFE